MSGDCLPYNSLQKFKVRGNRGLDSEYILKVEANEFVEYRVFKESGMTSWFGYLSIETMELPFTELETIQWGYVLVATPGSFWGLLLELPVVYSRRNATRQVKEKSSKGRSGLIN